MGIMAPLGSALMFSIFTKGEAEVQSSRNTMCNSVGAALFGVGYGLFTAAIIIFAGYSVPKELRIGVMARILIFTGIGEFVSAFVMDFVKTSIFHSTHERFSFLFAAVCLLILAVAFLIKPKSKLFSSDAMEELE